ncbi:MAG: hypothetical protein ACLFPO_06475 [Spirochaetaceae bacterium]
MRLRLTYALGLLLAVATLGCAETVMVSVRDESGFTDEDYRAASRYELTAVEDGMMGAFFEAGHIVFNLGDYEHFEGSDIQRRYDVRSAAREGGASYVVQLALVLDGKDESSLRPEQVDYELWAVDSGERIAAGTRSAPFDFDAPDSERGSRSAELGRRVAMELLSEW